MTQLVYCAAGNRKFAEIAIRHGFSYGAQLPNTIYYPPVFVDQNWKNPQRDKYIDALKTHRPALATVLDLERENQLSEVLSWADEAAQYVTEAVIIIPKVMDIIPRLPRLIRNKQVRLGYSVPTRFAGTCVPIWEFQSWPIHLLGGSPHQQMKVATYLNAQSADGNYSQKMAVQHNQFFTNGTARYARNRYYPRLGESVFGHIDHDAPYFAFALSCMNIQAAWVGCKASIRYAVESDVSSIKRIANAYKQELGYVMYPALREAITRRELYVAEYDQRIVGFIHWHRRKDGWATVYEIAVHRECLGQHIGAGLLASIPKPIRLKCPVDNQANGFYSHLGMLLTKIEPGRKRALNNWEIT